MRRPGGLGSERKRHRRRTQNCALPDCEERRNHREERLIGDPDPTEPLLAKGEPKFYVRQAMGSRLNIGLRDASLSPLAIKRSSLRPTLVSARPCQGLFEGTLSTDEILHCHS